MAGKPAVRYVANVGGHWIDRNGKNVRFRADEIYRGPDPEKYVESGMLRREVVPAPAGSNPGGSEDDEGGVA